MHTWLTDLQDISGVTGPKKASDGRHLNGRTGDDDEIVALAHALRTPLTTIRSVAEILQDHPDLSEAKRNELIQALAEEAQRLHRTVDQMLLSLSTIRDRSHINLAASLATWICRNTGRILKRLPWSWFRWRTCSKEA